MLRVLTALVIACFLVFLLSPQAKSADVDWNFDKRLAKVETAVNDHEDRLKALEGKATAKSGIPQTLKSVKAASAGCECGTNCGNNNCPLNGGAGYCPCTGNTYTQGTVTYGAPVYSYSQPVQYQYAAPVQYAQPVQGVAGFPRPFRNLLGRVRDRFSTRLTTAPCAGGVSMYNPATTGGITYTPAATTVLSGTTSGGYAAGGCANGACQLR